MTKDVLISISGLQMDVLEEEKEYEPIEVVAPANYFLKNGKHYILFDEVTEGIPGITKNRIKITGEDALEVMKSGVSNVHMVFEKNKKNLTYYQTPYGQLLIGIHTKEMEVDFLFAHAVASADRGSLCVRTATGRNADTK